MAYVLKIKHDGTLRKFFVQNRPDVGGPNLTYCDLELKIRDLFALPSNLKFSLTYIDKDNDQITIGDDQDIIDALVTEGLNPLRLDVVPETGNKSNQDVKVHDFAQKQQVVEHEFEGTDKHIQSEYLRSIKGPSGTGNLDVNSEALHEPGKKTEPVSQIDVPVDDRHDWDSSNCQTSSLRSGSSSSFNPNEFRKFSADLVPSPEVSLPPPYSATIFSDASNQDQNYPFSNPSAVLAKNSNEVLSESSSFVEFKERKYPSIFPPAELTSSNGARTPYTPSVHYYVTCDGCRMNPIVGSRFKSRRLSDYDLCGKCFNKERNKSDYFEVAALTQSHAVAPQFPGHRLLNAVPMMAHNQIQSDSLQNAGSVPSRMASLPVRNPVSNTAPSQNLKGKMDSQVVQDVTVPEGTLLPVGIKFTKTWRLKNIGKYPWPLGTKLVRVAGDDLGSAEAAITELSNVPPEDEVEVSLVLVAPSRTGSYVSHWRLMMPSGEKFGHRMWVLIETRTNQS